MQATSLRNVSGGQAMSIESKAKQAAGRAKCDKCKFWVNKICIDPRVAEVCYANFIKGYIKGYNQRKKEENK